MDYSNVYVGFRPLVDPGWLAYNLNRIERSFFKDSRIVHTFCIIQWPGMAIKYELELKEVSKKSAMVLVKEQPKLVDQDPVKYYEKNYPDSHLVYIGQTNKTHGDAVGFIEKYSGDKPRYSAFWENCRTFTDGFLKDIVTRDAAWKLVVVKQDKKLAAPSEHKFDSPLEYVHWHKKKYHKKKSKNEKMNLEANLEQDGRITMTFTNFELDGKLPTEEDNQSDWMQNSKWTDPPVLNVLIMIVGSRGDVQPFVALGQRLKKFGHRVRLATHEIFRSFVTENGLEFFPLAGDPAELMAYMVKNPSLIPKMNTILAGDVQRKRQVVGGILNSCWKACIESEVENDSFIPDAIISNPPTFAHIHCAEKLSVPLHVFFTMPWSPTSEFPHPLANLKYEGNTSNSWANAMSYDLVENLSWQGLGDIINDFRHELGLQGLKTIEAPRLLHNLKVPHTYCWSPNLIPKPNDWGPHIDIAGFFFLDLATNYTPPPDLAEFLNHPQLPIYIGFGSIVVDDPDALTKTIFEAVKRANVRAIVSKGWGGLGSGNVPGNIYLIGNCPHDWLFKKVSAVCHHGGAGTTAAGLLAGKPTIIVPFFGDQPFWGAMVAAMGVGPPPIAHSSLTVEMLADAIEFALMPGTLEAAQELGWRMREEDGVEMGLRSFHRHLPNAALRCQINPKYVARLYCHKHRLRLSLEAAGVLIEAGKISADDLEKYGSHSWQTRNVPNNLLEGFGVGALSITSNTLQGVQGFFVETGRGVQAAIEKPSSAASSVAYGLGRGVGAMVYYPLKGTGALMQGISSGLYNTNAAIDSRESKHHPGTAKNAMDGAIKGTVALAKGVGDGVTDFFVKPVRGAEQGGGRGLLTGLAQGAVSLTTKPLAGALDFVVLSAQGGYNSLRRRKGTDDPNVIKNVTLSKAEKQQILRNFDKEAK